MTNKEYPIAVYESFATELWTGSEAAIIRDTADIPQEARLQIAQELGFPATGFVDRVDGRTVHAQFFSTVMELPMCGHGTIALVRDLVGIYAFGHIGKEPVEINLSLPKTTATVRITNEPEEIKCMLSVQPATFRRDRFELDKLCGLFGLDVSHLASHDIETAVGDFVHLLVPLTGLAVMDLIEPDIDAIKAFCHAHDIETIVVFCMETEDETADVHVRDFCPAVGVAESAAGGTTNAALTCGLIRQGYVQPSAVSSVRICAEQGIEIGRTSKIYSEAHVEGCEVIALWVGGFASRVNSGSFHA